MTAFEVIFLSWRSFLAIAKSGHVWGKCHSSWM